MRSILARLRTIRLYIKEESTVKEYICKACEKYKLAPGERPEDLPSNWKCPVCWVGLNALEELVVEPKVDPILDSNLPKDLSFGQLSALFSNLAKGCDKQGKSDEKTLFETLSDHYNRVMQKEPKSVYTKLDCLLGEELERDFYTAMKEAKTVADRGAQRALVWTKKVSYTMRSLLEDKAEMLAMIGTGKSVHVCQICGFVIVDDNAPDRCPVCGVPKFKIKAV